MADQETVTTQPDERSAPASPADPPRFARRIASLVLVAIGVGALVSARPLEVGELTSPGPGMWPLTVATVVAITAGILFFTDLASDYEPWDGRALVIAAGIAALAIFVVLFQIIGFTVSAFLFLLVWLRFFARESWRLSLVLAVAGSLGMYLIFAEFFAVPFPDGVLAPFTFVRS